MYLSNAIDYFNFVLGRIVTQGFTYKKDANDIVVTGGKFYVGSLMYDVEDLDTSLALPGKTLTTGVTNYVYLDEGEYVVQIEQDNAKFLIATVFVEMSGEIGSITNHRTYAVGTKGEIGNQ